MNTAVGTTYSHYPLPHIQEPDYAAILRTLSYQTRGIFERLRDLFNGRAYIQLSLDLITSHIGCSRGLLVSVLQELEALGLLKVYRQRIGPRRNEINRYVLPEALIHPSIAVQPVNLTPRLAVYQANRQPSSEVHVMNFPRARESVRQEDGFLPSAASTGSERRKKEEAEEEDVPSSVTRRSDFFSENEKAFKVKVLTEAGIHPRNHKKLLAYPLADLQRAIELAREHADESFDGYVVTVLRQGFFDDETKVPPPQVEKIPPVSPRASVVELVKPFQEVETAAPEPAQPPVSGHPQPQPQTQPVAVSSSGQGFFDDETKVPPPQVEKIPPVVARADVVQGVKPFQEVETAAPDAPEPAQPPVSGHPQQPQANEAPPLGVVRPDEVQQPQPTPQPAKNLDDPRGEKAALFQSVGLKPQHYTPFITYSLSDIQAAIQSARERQARHVGHYALAILKKQPAPPHQTIDYELLMNRWQEYEAPKAAPPPDENYNIWMAFGKTALATMGDKHLWPKIQHAYHSFIVETDELLLRRDKLPDHDGFVRQFVDRVQMIPWKRQETDPSKRFCVKVKLI